MCRTSVESFCVSFFVFPFSLFSLSLSTQNFQGCGQRLEYALTPTPSQPNPRASTTSHLLQCFTVERHCSGRGLDEDGGSQCGMSPGSTFAFSSSSHRSFLPSFFSKSQPTSVHDSKQAPSYPPSHVNSSQIQTKTHLNRPNTNFY